jgi:hypothetical protein
LRVQHTVALVALDLPAIRGVRFTNVDNEKGYLIAEAAV